MRRAPCQAVLDFGHARTNVCIVRGGEPIYARTIRRGGEHLTAAIAKAFKADLERAEQAKRGERVPRRPGSRRRRRWSCKLDSVLREALAPTMRELRQTLASFRAAPAFDVDALLVVGGGGRLAGLLPFLEAELGLPARFRADPAGAGQRAEARSADVAGRAEARERRESDVARAGGGDRAGGRAAARARSTSAAVRSSTAPASRCCARRRWHLAALAGGDAARGWLDVGAKLLAASAPSARTLDKELKTATQELFGKPRDDAEAIAQLMRKGFREELAPLPKATAFDLLDQISRKVPPADKVKLDVASWRSAPRRPSSRGPSTRGRPSTRSPPS